MMWALWVYSFGLRTWLFADIIFDVCWLQIKSYSADCNIESCQQKCWSSLQLCIDVMSDNDGWSMGWWQTVISDNSAASIAERKWINSTINQYCNSKWNWSTSHRSSIIANLPNRSITSEQSSDDNQYFCW